MGNAITTKRAGRPRKPLDVASTETIVEVLPQSPLERLETLLIFDARALERETQLKLLKLLPELIQVRRAWKAHYLEHGCISCPKADETVAIAARMRLRHYTWEEILAVVAPHLHTLRDKKCFQKRVYWRLEHPEERAERDPNAYGSGGLCNACQARIMTRMRNRYRKAMAGRDPEKEFAKFKDTLALRFNAAQRLFNGGDE